MRIPPRIAAPVPPRAADRPRPRAGSAGVAAVARVLPRGHGLASGLLGVLGGLAAGAVITAAAPGVGRVAAAQALPPTAGDDGSGPRGGGAAGPVSAVLAPAIEVGVLPSPDPEAVQP